MDIDGTWNLTVNSPMGKQVAVFDLKADGGRLVGRLTNPDDGSSTDIFDGAVDGDTLTWKVAMSQYRMTLVFTTKIDGGSMAGKVKAGIFGNFGVQGHRA